MTVVRLLECSIPGEIIGKEVIDKNSALIGICLGVLFDLKAKSLYLVVGGREYTLKVPMNAIIDISKEFIRVDMTVHYDSMSSKDVENLVNLLQQEALILAKMMLGSSGKLEKTSQRSFDMLRLFNLI